MQAVLLSLRYADRAAIGAWFVPSCRAQKKRRFTRKKKWKKNKKRKEKTVLTIGPETVNSLSAIKS